MQSHFSNIPIGLIKVKSQLVGKLGFLCPKISLCQRMDDVMFCKMIHRLLYVMCSLNGAKFTLYLSHL